MEIFNNWLFLRNFGKREAKFKMSVCTYIASDVPLREDPILWPLSRGAEDVLTQKRFVAQVEPDLEDMTPLLVYIHDHMKISNEMEAWHIWQGVDDLPVVRSLGISEKELTVRDLMALTGRNVFETTTQYGLPIQYRIVVTR